MSRLLAELLPGADLSDLAIDTFAFEAMGEDERLALKSRVFDVVGDLATRVLNGEDADWVMFAATPDGPTLHRHGTAADLPSDDFQANIRAAQGIVPFVFEAAPAA